MMRFICGWIRVMLKLSRPGGAKAMAAENIVLRQQLIALSRHHKRSPKLNTSDRILFGFLCGLINPKRIIKVAIVIKPSTIIKFHKALVKRKYQWLFSDEKPRKSGPKGPSDEIVRLIVEMKKRNPRYGYLRIAMQIQNAFNIGLDEGVVRRVLNKHYKPSPFSGNGPSWLTFIGQLKDSLWSVDLFRCESILLKSYWVMILMGIFCIFRQFRWNCRLLYVQ